MLACVCVCVQCSVTIIDGLCLHNVAWIRSAGYVWGGVGWALYLQLATLYEEGVGYRGGGVCTLAWGLLRDSVVYHQAPLRQKGGWGGMEGKVGYRH